MDPEQIEEREFAVVLRGYAREEVRTFCEELAERVGTLRRMLGEARADAAQTGAELSRTSAELVRAQAEIEEQREKLAEGVAAETAQAEPGELDRAAAFKLIGQETERILMAAEQAAEEMHQRAMQESAEILTDARHEVQRSLADLDAARRAAEEDFAAIADSRSMVASQLEDIRRRLEETISRLRVPVELPAPKPAGRYGGRGVAALRPTGSPDAPTEQQLQEREREAARELHARQNAHRLEAERREAEMRAARAKQRESQEAADLARERAEREAKEQAEREAREKAEREAREKAERQAREKAEHEERLRAENEARRQAEEEARRKAERDARQEAERKAQLEAERESKAEAGAERRGAQEQAKLQARQLPKEPDRKAEGKREAVPPAGEAADGEPDRPAQAGRRDTGEAATDESAGVQSTPGGSSLDALLAEIRRKRDAEKAAEQAANAGVDKDQERADKDRARGAMGAIPATNGKLDDPEPAAGPKSVGQPESRARPEVEWPDSVLGDLPAQTARRLKRILQEEHNALLDLLRKRRGKGSLEENLPPSDEQEERFQRGLRDALAQAYRQGARAGGAEGEPDASSVIERLVNRQILVPLRSEVGQAIGAGLEAEDSASVLSERANDVFRVWKGVRTQMLGEGIAHSAYHQGLLVAWEGDAGVRKAWVLGVEDECPNDLCRRNAESDPIELGKAFPSGHQSPPAHGGCSCTLSRV